MTSRRFHIVASLKNRLQNGQVDAIELACMDCGYEVFEHETLELALPDLQSNSQALLMLDTKTLVELIDVHKISPNSQVILCASDRENPELAAYTSELAGMRYVIGAPLPNVMRGVLASILEFRITGSLRGLMPRLLQLQSFDRATRTLTNSAQRGAIQDFVTDFFAEKLAAHKEQMVGGTSSYPKNIGDVVDEFLMNAIWDAAQSRVHQDRTKPTPLDDGEEVLAECVCDGVNLALTVTDPHGSFPAQAFLKPLRYALGFRGDTKVNDGPGGAGLGLFMILQKVTALSYEVEKGKITRAVALLRGDQSMRELQKKPRTVLFFEKS